MHPSGKVSRVVFAPGQDEAHFETNSLPIQWQGECLDVVAAQTYSAAWLRRSRSQPPSEEELHKAERTTAMMRARVDALQAADAANVPLGPG